jgi:feruloyl esterase
MIDWLCPALLKKGYACLASDMGHEGRIEDGLWAYNNLQAELDFGYRAAHVTALAGKAISEDFYGRAPDRSYFCGCSTGGREGLVEAQRFPWDFDGIIAGAPASDQAGTIMTRLWAALALRASDGRSILSQADLQVIHKAVVVACDMNDGVRDGLIGDPRACHFEVGDLTCRGDAKDQCLSNEQVGALGKIYSGPTTSTGKRIYADGALMFGSELAFGEYYQSGHFSPFDTDYLKYMAFLPAPGPDWQISDLDFEHYSKRFGMTDALYAANNPDLRAFKARGGKLIMYQGWADAGAGGVPPLKAVNYYETTEKTMGGPAATRDFFRLFMLPGMGHCGGGEGASNVDYVSYLEEWVEKGRAPDALLATHNGRGESIFTRPVFPYPTQAKYKGVGDPASADSFKPTDP